MKIFSFLIALMSFITASQNSLARNLLFRGSFETWQGFAEARVRISGATVLRSIAVGDITGDGIIDVLTLDNDNQKITVFRGTAQGNFNALGTAVATIADPQDIFLAYVDDDAVLDLIVRGYFANGFATHLGNGDGSFQTALFYPLSGHGMTLTTGDFNNDGRTDIAATNAGSGQPIHLNIFLNQGNGQLQLQQTYATAFDTPNRIRVCDLNRDAYQDLVISTSTPYPVIIFPGSANADFLAPLDLPPIYQPYDGSLDFACHDADNDGDDDITVTHFFGNPKFLTTYINSGNLSFSSPVSTDIQNYAEAQVTSTDLDQNGTDDLIFSEYGGTALKASLGFTLLTIDAGKPVKDFIVGDIDGDRYPDILTINTDNTFSILQNKGE